MRALDYLETRKDVDCSRVGVCGTSGGGTQSAYLQALDPRIRVAFPNCFVSSVRAVFAERGCHDAEQFFWDQLNVGVNHAAILENLRLLDLHRRRIVLRLPMIPNLNDGDAELAAIGRLADELKSVEALDVEPYNPYGVDKAKKLGLKIYSAPRPPASYGRDVVRRLRTKTAKEVRLA